jgi:hypothetical protein
MAQRAWLISWPWVDGVLIAYLCTRVSNIVSYQGADTLMRCMCTCLHLVPYSTPSCCEMAAFNVGNRW